MPCTLARLVRWRLRFYWGHHPVFYGLPTTWGQWRALQVFSAS